MTKSNQQDTDINATTPEGEEGVLQGDQQSETKNEEQNNNPNIQQLNYTSESKFIQALWNAGISRDIINDLEPEFGGEDPDEFVRGMKFIAKCVIFNAHPKRIKEPPIAKPWVDIWQGMISQVDNNNKTPMDAFCEVMNSYSDLPDAQLAITNSVGSMYDKYSHAQKNTTMSGDLDYEVPKLEDLIARYEIYTATDALLPREPRLPIIDPWSGPQEILTLVSDPGKGKTQFMLWTAARATNGLDVLGHATKKVNCLYIDEEMSKNIILDRLEAIYKGDPQINPKDVSIDFISNKGFDLVNPKSLGDLELLIVLGQYDVIVLDALIAFVPEDENGSVEMKKLTSGLRQIMAHTGCSFWILHHNNRNGRYRGSSVIESDSDFMLSMESRALSKTKNELTFKATKHRHSAYFEFSAEVNFENGEYTINRVGADTQQPTYSNKAEQIILEALKHGPRMRSELIKPIDGLTTHKMRDTLYDMVNRRIIYRTNPNAKGRGAEAIFALNSDPFASADCSLGI